MKKFLTVLFFSIACPGLHSSASAQDSATNAVAAATNAVAAAGAKKADPDINQRVADLEAYVSNGSRGSDATDAKVSSKLDGVAGPGHNAWMMTSSALVLFMTLPGLALFYGGLMRRDRKST